MAYLIVYNFLLFFISFCNIFPFNISPIDVIYAPCFNMDYFAFLCLILECNKS